MSDPVTNVEIEDVLSSIRKLVAEDVRTPPVARRPEKPGRLILTAAQRVRDEEPEGAGSKEPVLLTQPILPKDAEPAELDIDEIPGDARLADFGEVEGAFPDIDTLDTPEETAPEDVDDQAWSDEAEPEGQAEETAEAEPVEDVEPEAKVEDSRGDLNRMIEEEVSAALAEAEPASNDDEDDDTAWLVDDPEDGDWIEEEEPVAEAELPQEDAWQDDDEPVEAQTVEEPPVFDDQPEEAAIDPTPAPPLTLEDKVAALGRLVARGSQEFEEERDRPDADELSAISEPMSWPEAPYEAVEKEPVAEGSNVLHAPDAWPKPQAEEPAATQAMPALPERNTAVLSDDMGALEIDEETLRQMVGEIVRQELQGALGERITRNVRKLVRREIHRMLISQDFE